LKAYKGFSKDLKCLGYQFKEGKLHIEKEANCVRNGFHCAENLLDCLTYYPNWDNSVYYIVEASGDIHEDGSDSKISCTELSLIKKLSLEEFVEESIEYMRKYPLREWNRNVREEKSNLISSAAGFIIVRGKHPMAAGVKGTVIGLVKEDGGSQLILDIVVAEVNDVDIHANVWYTVKDGRLVPVDEEAI
jgi:hypothetical protein